MRRRLVSPTVALAVVAGFAGPAAANSAGVFLDGTLVVGKTATFCNHDGASDVSGNSTSGLGLPLFSGEKQAFYAVERVTVTVFNDATKTGKEGVSTGELNACGRLRWIGKVAGGTAVGAACGMSKGYHGKGRIDWRTGPKTTTSDYFLHDITWKATAAGSIPFWASGQQGAIRKGESGTDLVTGTVNAQGGAHCVTKAGEGDGKSGGATVFNVNGAFEVLNDQWVDPQHPGLGTQESPGICKDTGNPLCAYDTKKAQTPKQDGD